MSRLTAAATCSTNASKSFCRRRKLSCNMIEITRVAALRFKLL
jgi:hypothetical protein